MFKNHPKGLLSAAFANMGERFGFYTMMAVLVLFLQAKFGYSESSAGTVYSIFIASIYVLSLVGGIIADKTSNYKATVGAGLVIMSLGYVLLAYPTITECDASNSVIVLAFAGLFFIAFGNGLFKGNLQALVGIMYDKPEYSDKRDSGFSIFYMFINIGAFLAPFAAIFVRNYTLEINGFDYKAEMPQLCRSYLHGMLNGDNLHNFEEQAMAVSHNAFDSLNTFAAQYLDVFTRGFHYAFFVAVFAMLISLTIFVLNRKRLPDVSNNQVGKSVDTQTVKISIEETRRRLFALYAVFGIVIFFWFSFHQNGLTLTYFARDYTFLNFFGHNVSVENFQSINPCFIILLTPLTVWLFSVLKKKGKEPSTPAKIAIGMGVAATAYLILLIGSYSLPDFATINPEIGCSPLSDVDKVTPWLLVIVYFILTVAELFISPLGLSFVSKVAPPQYRGLMQGGWMAATAVGNLLVQFGAIFYTTCSLAFTWTIFVCACAISLTTMLFLLKRLEKACQ